MRNDACVLDTSFVSALLIDDVHTQDAMEKFSLFSSGYFYIPLSVLLEFSVAYKGQAFAQQAMELLSEVMANIDYEIVFFDKDFLNEYMDVNELLSVTVKPMDLTILTCAVKYQVPLLTFDKKLAAISETLVK